ncbi:MAG: efflux RND transporter permease subunit, partial [Chromatiaceae bacterium]|nr:efflux RND transporter permease subunit [Candidatus Thioaporhodococcus sediminis]
AFNAAMAAARLRIRPIVMTSLAFGFGVLPLAISTGAGSGGQNSVGTGVLGGVAASTLLGVFFVPLFFVLIRGRSDARVLGSSPGTGPSGTGPEHRRGDGLSAGSTPPAAAPAAPAHG